MKIRLPLLVSVVLALTGCGPKADFLKKALTGATLVDGTGSGAIPMSMILIDNGMITFAGPAASTKIPDGFETVNVAGKFVVPGLVDARVISNADPKTFLQAGITSVGLDSKVEASGFADLVIASNSNTPEATFAKIERMAKAEIPTLQIIRAATRNGAARLGQTNLGAIKAGQRADLLVLNADPLADIKNLRQIYRIMLDGHWVETSK